MGDGILQNDPRFKHLPGDASGHQHAMTRWLLRLLLAAWLIVAAWKTWGTL